MAVVKGATVNARENNIDKALLRAQAAVAGVQKNARNDFAGYDYVSADGMVGQLRQILLNEGLVFGRRTWEIVDDNVVSHLFLSHAESGERWQWTASMPIVITKGRPADKSVLGALTTCLSYVLRDLLLVPRVDELEVDNRRNDDVLPTIGSSSDPRPVDLVAEVEKAARAKGAAGETWINGCIERAAALEKRRIRSLNDVPDKYLIKMLERKD